MCCWITCWVAIDCSYSNIVNCKVFFTSTNYNNLLFMCRNRTIGSGTGRIMLYSNFFVAGTDIVSFVYSIVEYSDIRNNTYNTYIQYNFFCIHFAWSKLIYWFIIKSIGAYFSVQQKCGSSREILQKD